MEQEFNRAGTIDKAEINSYYVALGSNMGDREGYIRAALAALAADRQIVMLQAAPLYETEPWGKTDQPAFLNGVCRLTTELAPENLLDLLQQLEAAADRTRKIHWGPRTLDLDIIFGLQGAEVLYCSSDRLQLPHPYFWDRAFVLVPLHDLEPEFSWQGQLISERIGELGETGIRAL